MKSPTDEYANSGSASESMLSRLLSVDELLIRPTAEQAEESLFEPAKAPAARISLERFQELEQCIRNSPADPAPYLELAQIYIQQERWKDARRVLDQGCNHNPEHEQLVILREETMLQSSHRELDAARRFLRQNRTVENEQHLSRCEIDLANLRYAVCESRLSRHPEQKELNIPCAIALRQLGRMEEAIAKLKMAQSEPSLRARASLQLGMCYQQTGDILEALAAYRRASLFRAPPPPTEIRQRALQLAAELAEEHGMVHAAIQYLQALLESPHPQTMAIRKKLEILTTKPL